MTAQDLKNSILQRAIEGKLVPQRQEEGTAKELLAKIRAEKARLIKEKKIKKSKPLPAITDDEKPFDIPESWEWVRLDYLVYNHGQKKPNDIFCYIDIGSIDNKEQKLANSEKIILPESAPSRARKIVKEGDILYATVRPYLHNMCIVDRQFSHETIASTGFAVMATHSGVLNRYLFFYLLSSEFDRYANANENAKGVAYPAINDTALYKACISLPPLAEQRRIVAKIEELLPDIDAYDKAQTKVQSIEQHFPGAMKKSLLQYAIEGKLVPQRKEEGTAKELLAKIRAEKARLIKEKKIKKSKPLPEITDAEKPFDIPESWEWVRLTDLCANIVDCPHSTPKYFTSNTGYYAIDTNVIDSSGKLTGWRYVNQQSYLQRITRLTPKHGDVVLTREGSIGRAAILPSNKKICLGQRVMLLRPSAYVDAKFIKTILMAPSTLIRLTIRQKGLGAKHINVSDVCNLVLPLPPLAEQHRMVARLEELLPLCDALAAQL